MDADANAGPGELQYGYGREIGNGAVLSQVFGVDMDADADVGPGEGLYCSMVTDSNTSVGRIVSAGVPGRDVFC